MSMTHEHKEREKGDQPFFPCTEPMPLSSADSCHVQKKAFCEGGRPERMKNGGNLLRTQRLLWERCF